MTAFAYINRGSDYWTKGDNDRAIVDYTKAIEINPKKGDDPRNRCNAYSLKSEYDRAILESGRPNCRSSH